MQYREEEWAREGKKYKIQQVWVPYAAISPYLIKAVLIGEDEIARNVVALRDLDSGEQNEVPMDQSLSELRARLRALYD